MKWKWKLLGWCQLAYNCVGAWMVASSRAANYQRRRLGWVVRLRWSTDVSPNNVVMYILWSRMPVMARLVSELKLACLARESKHKNTVHRDYNRKLATNTSHAYLKSNKQNKYEFWTRLT